MKTSNNDFNLQIYIYIYIFQLLKLFSFLSLHYCYTIIIFAQRETSEIRKTNHPVSDCTTIAEASSL